MSHFNLGIKKTPYIPEVLSLVHLTNGKTGKNNKSIFRQILDSSTLREFADDNLKFDRHG